ncbi:aminoacetone oxidase family FAD-binding enzyme, partial [Staphylococcus hominis]
FPTEVPITSNESFIKEQRLKGLSLKDVCLSVHKKNGKIRISHKMDMIFTHFGISGPAALRCSQFIYKEQKQQKTQQITMSLDVFPDLNKDKLSQKINKRIQSQPNKIIKISLNGLNEARYSLFTLE